MRRFWLVGLLALFAACGGKDERPQTVDPTVTAGGRTIQTTGGKTSGGGGGSSGKSTGGGSSDAGATGEGGGGGATSVPPVVEITSPADIENPNDGALVGDEVTVRCKASQGEGDDALPVSLVKISLIGGDDRPPEVITATRTDNEDEYVATFQIGLRPSGAIRFVCTASDVAKSSATAEIGGFIDRGPVIEVTSPIVDSSWPLTGGVPFVFSVTADPLVTGDTGAKVGEVTLVVDGVAIKTLARAPGRPGVYQVGVDFTDAKLFPQTPTGNIAVTIRATNLRQPEAAVAKLNYNFVLDGLPPTVTITSPGLDRIIAASLTVAFTAKDDISGINLESIEVSINGESYPYDPDDTATWQRMGDNFTFEVDRSKITSKSQAHIVVSADDDVGNGPATDTREVYIDEQPPFVTLDMPNIRTVQKGPNGEDYCSISFDPLGDAISDGDPRPNFSRIRAFMWDFTNGAPGQEYFHYAGVKASTAYLHVQRASDPAPLIDSNGDGVCDAIRQETLENQRGTVRLDLIPAGGERDEAPSEQELTREPLVSGCTPRMTNHKHLCAMQSSDLETVTAVDYPSQSGVTSAIFGVDVNTANVKCTGGDLDLTNLVPAGYEGWLCIVAHAQDDVANEGVSAPLRICLDNGSTATHPTCATRSEPLPSCVDDCEAPPYAVAIGDHEPLIIRYSPPF